MEGKAAEVSVGDVSTLEGTVVALGLAVAGAGERSVVLRITFFSVVCNENATSVTPTAASDSVDEPTVSASSLVLALVKNVEDVTAEFSVDSSFEEEEAKSGRDDSVPASVVPSRTLPGDVPSNALVDASAVMAA